MLERLRRVLVVICITVTMMAAGLTLGQSASAATSATDAVKVASVTTAATSGVQRVYLSVDSLTSSTADDTVAVPTDSASAAAFVASLNAYWNRETGGAVTIVLGGFETRSLSTSCSVSSLFVAGRAADFNGMFADTSDWTGTSNHLLAMSRESCSSSSVGQGSVGGDGGVMSSTAGSSSASLGLAVAAHEFGHNLGFLHANVDTCPSGSDSGSTCATTAYSDLLDVMGGAVSGSVPHESTPQLISLGYLTDYASLSQTSGIVQQTLMPVGATSGPRSIVITDPATGEQYYVEYRIADAADAASPEFSPNYSCTTASNGLQRCWGGMSTTLGGIRVLRVGADGTSVLSIGTYGSTHLDLGQSFQNHDSAFELTVSSLSPTAGATITVAFGASSIAQESAASAVHAPSAASSPQTPTAATTTPTASTTTTPAVSPIASTASPTNVVMTATMVNARLRHSTITLSTHPVVVAIVTGVSRPTGTLTVWANGKRIRTVTLHKADAGVRAITLPRMKSTGKVAVRVTYSGTSNLAGAASAMKRLKVR